MIGLTRKEAEKWEAEEGVWNERRNQCLISLRTEDVEECCMLLEMKGVQRKRHSSARENLPEQGS